MSYQKIIKGGLNQGIFKSFFTKGHHRTLIAKKNIAASFFIKGGTILIMLMIVPMTINYVNPTQYGIWLTLTSIIAWFSFFDIGFGNGLKNKLAIAIAKGEDKLARSYVSTAYLIMTFISLILITIFLILNYFLDWSKILNAPPTLARELSIVSLIVFFIFSVQFVLQLLNIVCAANQNTALSALISFLGNLLGFIFIVILIKTTKGSLLYLCISIGLSPLLVLLIFTIILYNTSYKKFAPALKLANFSYAKDIMQLGFQFFLIQLGLIFLYNIDNIIISHVIGPSAVTTYNVAYKYFAVITMLSGIIMTPFWPAFTDANVKKDYIWIKGTVKNLEKLCLLIFLLSIFLLIISNVFYKIWIGDKVIIPFSLSAVLAFYTVLNTYRTIFCYYLNGVGKIRVQLYLIAISGLLNIPLGILMGKWLGITGVILATTFLCIGCAVIEIYQYKRLINNNATGIWNK